MQTQSNFQKIATELAPVKVLQDTASLKKYGSDYTHELPVKPIAITLPTTVQQVQHIINIARKHHMAVTPSGGRTGLTGGATASHGELIIAMDKMDKIKHFNPAERTITCEPGLILQNLQTFVQEKGFFYPVNLAAKGSCQLGGNIATNAGGINVIRYGSTRQWVAGLKVVTGTGELLELNTGGLLKNNTGYALHELFIGSEGTLGIIVEATMRFSRAPSSLQVMMLGHDNLNQVLETLEKYQEALDLTAFEVFDNTALNKVTARHNLPAPFSNQCSFYSLIEFERTDEAENKIMTAFETGLAAGSISDGVISQSESQRTALWRYREDITETLSQYSPCKYDLSVPVARFPEFHQQASTLIAAMEPAIEAVWFGHVGDGNWHLNILKPDGMEPHNFMHCCKKLNPEIFALLQGMRGSISAEHGIGQLKKNYLHYTRSEAEISLMAGIKKLFDPAGIMNPGKIFD